MFDYHDQDDAFERHLAAQVRETEAERNARIERALAGIMSIGTDEAVPILETPRQLYQTPELSQEEIEAERIYEEPAYKSRYDRIFVKTRKLEAEWKDLQDDPTATPEQKSELSAKVAAARLQLKKELKRGLDDVARRHEAIDEWRATVGREQYNAGRRKTRTTPNERLMHLTKEEKAQRKKDQSAEINWCARQRKAGKTEQEIAVALITWRAERHAKRAQEVEIAKQVAEMEAQPGFAQF